MAQTGGCSVTGGLGSEGAGEGALGCHRAGRGPSLLLFCRIPTSCHSWLHLQGGEWPFPVLREMLSEPQEQTGWGTIPSLFSLGFCDTGFELI